MNRPALLLVASLLVSRVALAQPAPAPSSSTAPASSVPAAPGSPADLAQAKELFRRGNALLQSNQPELALDLFLQSRALVPGVGNTTNAAICLDRLGRFDEALGAYELVLKEFSDRLTDEERRGLGGAMTALRRKVGLLDVAANVDGVLVIDGRRRGEVPLSAPIRLLPGPHTVRVLKDGYAPAEAVVDVRVGEERAVDLRLQVLTSTGRLRVVDEAAGGEREVLIDGAPVGRAPWEGTVGVGRHVVTLRGQDAGTSPSAAVAIAGQTVVVSLRAVPTGPTQRIEPAPLTATVFVDDVLLGAGPWEGRLPVGAHQVRVVEEGYRTTTLTVDGSGRGSTRVELPVDGEHPRWRRAQTARLMLELHGGYGLGSSLGGSAEEPCGGGCPDRHGPGAVRAGVRGVYLLPVGLALEVGGGYLRVATRFRRSVAATAPVAGQNLHTYELSDDIVSAGPYAALGLGYRRRLTRHLRAGARVTVGAHFASNRDQVTGQAARGAEREDVFVDRSGQSVRALNILVEPEVSLEATLGRWHAGLGLGLALFLLDGPSLPLGDVRASRGATACEGDASRLACIPADRAIAGARPYGPFHIWLPELTVGTTF